MAWNGQLKRVSLNSKTSGKFVEIVCYLDHKDKYTRQIKNFYNIMRFDMGEKDSTHAGCWQRKHEDNI